MFRRTKHAADASFQSQLDELRTRVGQLEEVNWEGRVQQLAALDKLLGKLNDRVRKKLERESSLEDAPGPTIDGGPIPGYPPVVRPRRLRGW